MKIKVILNPESKKGGSQRLEIVFREKFGPFLAGVERTAYPRHATEIARQAIEDNVDTIVAVGGDGTINEVVNAVVGTEAALGIIPTGTANDLASYYRIPADVAQACDVVLDHHIRRADVIRVNGWHYVTAGGVGLPSEVARIANTIKRAGRAGRMLGLLLGSKLYLLAVLCALVRGKGANALSVRWSCGLLKASALSFMVDNQPFLGKSFRMSPGAVNGDGMADVCLIRNPATLWSTVLIILKVLAGRHIHSSWVRTWRARQVTVDADEPLAFLGDGEIVQLGSRFNIRIIPQALRLVTPVQGGNS